MVIYEMLFIIAGAIALFSFLSVVVWSTSRRREREAYYKSETIKKIAEASGSGPNAALEFLREQGKDVERHRRGALRLGGLVTGAVGLGTMIFLRALIHEAPIFLAGLIPMFVGVALLVYAYVLAPKE